jgi:Flp pilus assembly protein TadB
MVRRRALLGCALGDATLGVSVHASVGPRARFAVQLDREPAAVRDARWVRPALAGRGYGSGVTRNRMYLLCVVCCCAAWFIRDAPLWVLPLLALVGLAIGWSQWIWYQRFTEEHAARKQRLAAKRGRSD